MDELETLKKEKSDTEEARKITEAHIESMKKDHEEKVIDTFLLPSILYLDFIHFVLKPHETLSKHRRACRHVHVLKPSKPFTKPSFMCSRAYAFPASRVLFSLVVFAEQPNTREKRPRKVGKHAHFLLAHRLITRRIWGTTELSKRVEVRS